MSHPASRDGALLLADGSLFEGRLFGAEVPASGEVVFNTVVSGYQEVLTDPSYAGQIIAFTASHIGNYGVNVSDFEARRPFCRGLVVRELSRVHSNQRAQADLHSMLDRYGIPGISGIDTRRLTRRLRDHGAMIGAFGSDEAQLRALVAGERGTVGVDLVSQVTTEAPYRVGSGERLIIAYDFGLKQSILRILATLGSVEVVPAHTSAEEVLDKRPVGVFLSNGPGDPEVVVRSIEAIRGLLGRVPVFGICLGHQLLSLAIGAETFKLPFGHHGGNHPVRHEPSGKVEITSQNHNFCVNPDSLPARAQVTHLNLNDHTVEGMRLTDVPAFSVQYHPEAGPGPHDSTYLFAMFKAMIDDPASWLAGRPVSVAVATRSTGYQPLTLIEPELGVA